MSVMLATNLYFSQNFLVVLAQFSSVEFHDLKCHYMQFEWTIMLKMAARNFLRRCTAFFNQIPIESLRIRSENAVHYDKDFLVAIFSIIVY